MNLIVTDFDGTFFDNDYLKNVNFINENRNAFDFIIATGRSYYQLQKDLKTFCNYYICNDGGYILNKDKEIIYKRDINYDSVCKIYSRILELGYKEYFFDNIETLSKEPFKNTNKIFIRIKNKKKSISDMEYLLEDLRDINGYISDHWININSSDSDKANAIEYIVNKNNYNKVYVVGNETNDYEMIKKYNGYFVTKNKSNEYNCINKFLDVKDIIKNDCE